MLKISDVKVFGVSIPLIKPMYMSGRSITHTENLIVRIEADGLTGWGEAASAPRMTGDILPGMVAVVDQFFKSIIIGQPISDYKRIIQQINKSVYNNSGPKCAISMALLDLQSKVNNVPMHTLLGEKVRDSFNSIAILGNSTIEEDIAEAHDLVNSGTDFFKIKVGKLNIESEIENTLRIRETLGPLPKLAADANAGLDIESTIRYCEAVKDANLLFLEQPLSNLSQLASINSRVSIPICIDESFFTKDDIVSIKSMSAGNGVNLKTIKLGGPLLLSEAADICSAEGISVNISSKVAETGIATAAMCHCAAVSKNLDWGISTTNQYLSHDIASFTTVSDSVVVDEYLLKQFTISCV